MNLHATRLCPTCGRPDPQFRDFCPRCGECLRWDAEATPTPMPTATPEATATPDQSG